MECGNTIDDYVDDTLTHYAWSEEKTFGSHTGCGVTYQGNMQRCSNDTAKLQR